jgi:hypothetical protein
MPTPAVGVPKVTFQEAPARKDPHRAASKGAEALERGVRANAADSPYTPTFAPRDASDDAYAPPQDDGSGPGGATGTQPPASRGGSDD